MSKAPMIMCILSLAGSAVAAKTKPTPPKPTPLHARAVAARMAMNPADLTRVTRDAAKGLPLAQDALGYLHLNGINQPINQAAALKAFKPGVTAGRHHAILGSIETHLQLGPQRNEQAAYQLAQTLSRTHPDGLAISGYLTLQGWGTRKDTRAGLSLLAQAVNKGSAAGDYFTFLAYSTGLAGRRDAKLAEIYFSSALTKGYSQAVLVAGERLISGNGASQNIKRGTQLLEQALMMGEGQAAERIAYHFTYPPYGYKTNYKDAQRAAKLCTAAENAMCTYLSAQLLIRTGTAATAPNVQALLKRAAYQGHPSAVEAYAKLIKQPADAQDTAILALAAKRKLIPQAPTLTPGAQAALNALQKAQDAYRKARQ